MRSCRIALVATLILITACGSFCIDADAAGVANAPLVRQLVVTNVVSRVTTERIYLAAALIAPDSQTLRDRVLSAFSDPNRALVLLSVGLLGIYIEFVAPGMIFPGVLGSFLALLALNGLTGLPLNARGVSLILLAFALFALEIKFVSYGVLSAAAAVALVVGAVMLVDSPVPEMRIRLVTALAVAVPFALITALLVTLAARARRNKVITGAEGMIGAHGVAMEALAPDGRVLVRGENWQARAPAPIAKGTRVRIVGIRNLWLQVEPLTIEEKGKS